MQPVAVPGMLGTTPIIPDLEGRRVLVTGTHRLFCVLNMLRIFSLHQTAADPMS